MSVADKVGQLFLVTFVGSDVTPGSAIAELVQTYRIGGVVLLASNRNFTNGPDTPTQIAQLTHDLQVLALSPAILPAATEVTSTVPLTSGVSLPLFIAIDHEGDGYPYTRIINGVTPLPNSMAIGATWNVANAETVGQIAGRELAALGINMLFGPSLDVLNAPRPSLKGDLGTRCFGGDPYWVGQMGLAYIRGLHKGSQGRVLAVAKHFPGLGGSDRRADEEVSTVPKSLQELRKIELAPFFTVTQLRQDDRLAVADALMSSHIRYRGFQGNIRQLTRPISFDAQNLQALMALPEFAPWRAAGGLMVTDALGVPAVRKYYDPQLKSFPAKRIAQDAFLAGNDLLVLSQFALNDFWPDQLANIKATILFFQEKYATDKAFQQRVDDALRRIIHLKLQLYPSFDPAQVAVPVEGVAERVAPDPASILSIAREAITLLYPGPDEFSDRLPSPPLLGERIVIFTDSREARDCPDCPFYPLITPTAIEETILHLYGPDATGQIAPEDVESFTFAQLKAFLTSAQPASEEEAQTFAAIERAFQEADWIILAMLDLNLDDYPDSDAVKQLLKLRPDSLRQKKAVALAYNAPYYLDTTEISKLTAYYGVYSKIEPFIEASVRVLFQEFQAIGASPVSVEGLNYDLITQTAPNPEQTIPLSLANIPLAADNTSPATIDVDVGDTLELVAGPILDRNGHLVPDGTPVTFRLLYPLEALELPRQEVVTIGGVARTTITVQREGQLDITASSDPAVNSVTLRVLIRSNEPAVIATVIPPTPTVTPTDTPAPTPTETQTPLPTPTPTSTGTFTATPLPTATLMPTSETTPVPPPVTSGDFGGAFGAVLMLGVLGWVLYSRGPHAIARGLQFFCLALIWGLAGYIIFVLGALAGVKILQALPKVWRASLFALVFGLVPLASGWRTPSSRS